MKNTEQYRAIVSHISRLNLKNLELIKSKMQHSTSEIRKIFKSEIENMRSVYEDLQETKTIIASHPTDTSINESIQKTEDILDRTSGIIKNMHGFVAILQCEDRITQMIDGISCVMQKHFDLEIELTQEQKDEMYESIKQCYTIQEQRDILDGKSVDEEGCENSQKEEEEFILF